jgi:hypothetical protein
MVAKPGSERRYRCPRQFGNAVLTRSSVTALRTFSMSDELLASTVTPGRTARTCPDNAGELSKG